MKGLIGFPTLIAGLILWLVNPPLFTSAHTIGEIVTLVSAGVIAFVLFIIGLTVGLAVLAGSKGW